MSSPEYQTRSTTPPPAMATVASKRGADNGTTLVSQQANKVRVVAAGKRSRTGQPISILPEHSQAVDGKVMYMQEVMAPAPPTTALSSTNYFSFMLESGSLSLIEDLTLRFDISFTSTRTAERPTDNAVLPVTQWFEKIEFIDRATNKEIVRYQGDILHAMLLTLGLEQRKAWAKLANFNPYTGNPVATQFETASSAGVTAGAAANHYFYLPLVKTWLDGLDLDMDIMRHDLEMKFYPRGSIFLNAQTAAPTVDADAITLGQETRFFNGSAATLTGIRAVAGSQMMSTSARLAHQAEKLTVTHQQNYLDWQKYDVVVHLRPGPVPQRLSCCYVHAQAQQREHRYPQLGRRTL